MHLQDIDNRNLLYTFVYPDFGDLFQIYYRRLGYEKRNSTIDRTIAEHLSLERYEFYRTAIILLPKFLREIPFNFHISKKLFLVKHI